MCYMLMLYVIWCYDAYILHIFKLNNLSFDNICYYQGNDHHSQVSGHIVTPKVLICLSHPSLSSWTTINLLVIIDHFGLSQGHTVSLFILTLSLLVQIFWDWSKLLCSNNLSLFIAGSVPLCRCVSARYLDAFICW